MPKTRNGGFRYGSSNSGFGRRSSFPTSKPTYSQSSMPTPSQGVFSGVGSTLAHGMAFGAGSEAAHQAIRSIMGPNYQTVYAEHLNANVPSRYQAQRNKQIEQLPCMKQINEFAQCLQQNESDISNCQFFLSQLKQCRGENEKNIDRLA